MVRFPGFQHEDTLLKHLGEDPEPFSMKNFRYTSSNHNDHTSNIVKATSANNDCSPGTGNGSYFSCVHPSSDHFFSSTTHPQSQQGHSAFTSPTIATHHQVYPNVVLYGTRTADLGAQSTFSAASTNVYHPHPVHIDVQSPVPSTDLISIPKMELKNNTQLQRLGGSTTQDEILSRLCNGMNAEGIPSGYIPAPPPPKVRAGQSQEDVIEDPSERDVLCGRGSRVNNHVGNVHFRAMIAVWKDLYLHPDRKKIEKAHICAYLVDHVRTNLGGRFLKLIDEKDKSNKWVEIGDVKARKKAGQALREDATDLRRETSNNQILQNVIERQYQEQQKEKQQREGRKALLNQAELSRRTPENIITKNQTHNTSNINDESSFSRTATTNNDGTYINELIRSTASALTESDLMRGSVASFQMSGTDHEAATMDFAEFLHESDREGMLLLSSPKYENSNEQHTIQHKYQQALGRSATGKPLSALRQQQAIYLNQKQATTIRGSHFNTHHDDSSPTTPLRRNVSMGRTNRNKQNLEQMELHRPDDLVSSSYELVDIAVPTSSFRHHRTNSDNAGDSEMIGHAKMFLPLQQLPANAFISNLEKKIEKDISHMSFEENKTEKGGDDDDVRTHKYSMMQESMVGSFHIATSSINDGLSGIDFAQFMKPSDREELLQRNRKTHTTNTEDDDNEDDEGDEEEGRAAFERAKGLTRFSTYRGFVKKEHQDASMPIKDGIVRRFSNKGANSKPDSRQTNDDSAAGIEQLSTQLMSGASIEDKPLHDSNIKMFLASASAEVRAKHLLS